MVTIAFILSCFVLGITISRMSKEMNLLWWQKAALYLLALGAVVKIAQVLEKAGFGF